MWWAIAQAIPAHRVSVQVAGATVFVVLLLALLALFRRTAKSADLERADELIEERWAQLEQAQDGERAPLAPSDPEGSAR